MNPGQLLIKFFFIALLSMVSAHADRLLISDYAKIQEDMPKPTLGMTQDDVIEQYGMPLEQVAAVGTPPITRWIYHDFIVFFEESTVIHSVIPYQKNTDNIAPE